jgi:hypothetical protein
MGLFDRFREGLGVQRPVPSQAGEGSADEQAIARYRYMLRTAPPETIEQAHAEAFAKLTPEQRRRVLDELRGEMPETERAAAARAGDSPQQLARLATRAEIRQPGVMERVFGGVRAAPGAAAGAGMGMGGLLAGGFLSSMAGAVVGSMIAQHFFHNNPEASQLFGDSSHDATDSAVHAADYSGSDDLSSPDIADIGDVGGDFGSGFDGGDSFDI